MYETDRLAMQMLAFLILPLSVIVVAVGIVYILRARKSRADATTLRYLAEAFKWLAHGLPFMAVSLVGVVLLVSDPLALAPSVVVVVSLLLAASVPLTVVFLVLAHRAHKRYGDAVLYEHWLWRAMAGDTNRE